MTGATNGHAEEDPRTKLLKLQAKQKEIEDEIESLTEQLARGRGLTGGLVDNEGFPVGDYGEILSTRAQRNRLAVLQTDYKELMKEIEQQLQIYHTHIRLQRATSPSPASTTDGASSSSTTTATMTAASSAPATTGPKSLAVVGLVSPDSAADASGLKVGDLVLGFGRLTTENLAPGAQALTEIATVAKETVGTILELKVSRNCETLTLRIDRTTTPTLGCRLDPYLS